MQLQLQAHTAELPFLHEFNYLRGFYIPEHRTEKQRAGLFVQPVYLYDLRGAFKICPLLNVSPSGKLVPIAKVRTKKKVLAALVDKMVQHAQGGLDYDGLCYISNSDCYEDAEFVKNLVLEKFKNVKDVPIFDIGTTIGCHTGTVALFFMGDQREDA